ncbi:MAG: transcription factor S [Candidatus Korarchaeota archaeon]|nr:transcription factor S [Candidatus Korarchaeota archaeon]NIU85094.1 transcription factor S [Candidatus Thorarchaeota archaeon]NIW15021.1 transcription factor S [Candidatus Thorarchaeota archaeon]NIW53031.1 transcription factor S [Candidatus Korarchaeota archaeon]
MEIQEEKKGNTIYICPVCNTTKSLARPTSQEGCSSVKIRRKKKTPEYIDESEIKREGSLVSEICPKCGHEGVWVVTRQTRSADEPETRIYHCPECGTGWREYS